MHGQLIDTEVPPRMGGNVAWRQGDDMLPYDILGTDVPPVGAGSIAWGASVVNVVCCVW